MTDKSGKYKSIQELLEAKQSAHNYCRRHIQGVVKNIQKLRRQLKKQKVNDGAYIVLMLN
jgi:hypothetical protein